MEGNCCLLDSSRSIGWRQWPMMLNLVNSIVEKFRVGMDFMRFGVVTFGDLATVNIRLNDHFNKSELMAEVNQLKWMAQDTNISGAIRTMKQEMFLSKYGGRPHAPDVAVLITDGESNLDAHLTLTEARKAKDLGIYMVTVGIGGRINKKELESIASEDPVTNKTQAFYIHDFPTLAALKRPLVAAIYSRLPVENKTTECSTSATRGNVTLVLTDGMDNETGNDTATNGPIHVTPFQNFSATLPPTLNATTETASVLSTPNATTETASIPSTLNATMDTSTVPPILNATTETVFNETSVNATATTPAPSTCRTESYGCNEKTRADPTSCGRFYRCQCKEVLESCSPGLHYDPDTGNCGWPRVDCKEVPVSFQCPSTGGIYPDPLDCKKFYICSNGQPEERICPHKLLFSAFSKTCDLADRVVCMMAHPSGYQCPERNGCFSHSSECNSYYACVDNVPEVKNCPIGLHFNPQTRLCDHPDRAGCRTVSSGATTEMPDVTTN